MISIIWREKNKWKKLFPVFDKHPELVYLDNAASTQKPKTVIAKLINCKPSEIIYSHNSTYCINLLAQALVNSWKLWKWDKVLLWIWEHHSNILPRKTLSKIFWFDIEFVNETEDFQIDWKDFDKKFRWKYR